MIIAGIEAIPLRIPFKDVRSDRASALASCRIEALAAHTLI
jgi:hypothetical protein